MCANNFKSLLNIVYHPDQQLWTVDTNRWQYKYGSVRSKKLGHFFYAMVMCYVSKNIEISGKTTLHPRKGCKPGEIHIWDPWCPQQSP